MGSFGLGFQYGKLMISFEIKSWVSRWVLIWWFVDDFTVEGRLGYWLIMSLKSKYDNGLISCVFFFSYVSVDFLWVLGRLISWRYLWVILMLFGGCSWGIITDGMLMSWFSFFFVLFDGRRGSVELCDFGIYIL